MTEVYEIRKTKKYVKDCKFFEKNDKTTYKKIKYIEKILSINPFFEFAKKERLKFKFAPTFSMRLTKEHRFIFSVYKGKIIVELLSCKGHYE